MKRKLFLLGGTFATVLAAYLAYYFSTAGLARADPNAPGTPGGAAPNPNLPVQSPVSDRPGLVITPRYPDGTLKAVYRFRKWDKQEDGGYSAQGASFVIYHKSGQRTYVYADRGEIYVDEIAGGIEPRKGTLEGNVRVYFDRGKDPTRPPPQERSRDVQQQEVVRVFTDWIRFDNDRLEMRTDAWVDVFAREADVHGHGLTARWRERPRELMLLRIEKGGEMTVYAVPEELEVMSLPGGKSASTSPDRPAPAPSAEPDPKTESAVAPPASRPAPVETAGGSAAGAVPAASVVATAPATRPAEPPRQNRFRAEFVGKVHVDAGVRHMHGAESLVLKFEVPTDTVGRARSRRRLTPAPSPTASSRPAASQPALPAGRPAPTPEAELTSPAGQPASPPGDERPGGRPAGKRAPDPLVITWTGPMVLTPAGFTADPQQDRFQISARGDRVVLWDDKATAICKSFEFRNPAQAGLLRGADGSPARLILAAGQELACDVIRFDRKAGKAYLDGPGYLLRREGKNPKRPDATGPFAGLAGEDPADRVSWEGSVAATFGQRRIERPGGKSDRREYIKDALFVGGVSLARGDGEDFVDCDRLLATIAEGPGGDYLSRVEAAGNVFARQEWTYVMADKATVTFTPKGEATKGGIGMVDSAGSRAETVEAEGNVVLLDQRDPNSPVRVVTADHVESDLVKRSGVLVGLPARIVEGGNRFEGDEIRFAEVVQTRPDGTKDTQRSVQVETPGSLEFETRKGLNGEPLKAPRPIRVAWGRRMDYSSAKGEAKFVGGVKLRSGLDRMACRQMRLTFETGPAPTTRPSATTQPATAPSSQPVKKASKRRMGLDMENYSARRIATITADGDVEVESKQVDQNSRLIRHLILNGRQLVYDANKAEMNVFSPGTLVLADYRPPSKKKDAGAAGSERIDRPHQMVFAWKKHMSLSQKARNVVMKQDVGAVFVSGRHMVLGETLDPPPPDWGKLVGGRISRLECQELVATFAPPKDDRAADSATPDVADGPRVGALESFFAKGNVHLTDGDRKRREAVCERMTFDQDKDVLTLEGSLPGRPRKDAQLTTEDMDAGTTNSVAGSKIIWFRKNDNVLVKDARATGGR